MEMNALSLVAAFGGFGMTLIMGGKVAFDTLRTRHNQHDDGDILKLMIDGKDFSVDLKTIGNGGSERIREALRELERC